jgi:tetratricopeptide (TPR) repeat protein
MVGCGTALPVDSVELDPLILRGDATGKVRSLEARPLFKEATGDYSEARYELALEKFLSIVEHFPKTGYAAHGLFNAGLTLQRLKRWDEALGTFRRAADRLANEGDRWDARYQEVVTLEQLGRWEEVEPLSQKLLDGAKLNVRQRIETTVRLGLARFRNGRLALAERALEKALEDYRVNSGVPSLKQNAYVSHAQFTIGEVYRGLFASVRFRLPVETMKRDLIDKSSFFLKAQSAYLRCIRLSHRDWSVAAGYKLGRLYEDFFRDMMAAEVPPDLDEGDRQVYFEELRSHIKPLVIRAIEIYERNLGMNDRLGGGGEWAAKTHASLERMRDVLRKEFGSIEAKP